MEKIASFQVDHTRLLPGMYISRIDDDVATYDIRFIKPNTPPFMPVAAMHTIEHLFATYARSSAWVKGIVYVGPMGCLTGFYLLTQGLSDAEALELATEAFEWMAAYEGPIPGASEKECGNYRLMDLPAARAACAAMVPVLKGLDAEHLRYQA